MTQQLAINIMCKLITGNKEELTNPLRFPTKLVEKGLDKALLLPFQQLDFTSPNNINYNTNSANKLEDDDSDIEDEYYFDEEYEEQGDNNESDEDVDNESDEGVDNESDKGVDSDNE